MNKGTRIVLGIAAGVLLLGIILAVIGFAMGGMKTVNYRNGDWSIQQNGRNSLSGQWIETEDEGEFHNIQIDVDFQEIRLEKSDVFGVVYSYDNGIAEMSHRFENDTLYVNGRYLNNVASLNVLGMNIPLTDNSNGRHSKVTIYYPDETVFGNVTLRSSAADIRISDLAASNINLEADFGNIKLENITANFLGVDSDAGDLSIKNSTIGRTEADLDFGQLKTDNLVSDGFVADCDSGNVDLKGSFRGETSISCEFGSVTLRTDLDKAEYRCRMNLDFGTLTVDGDSKGRRYDGGDGEHYLDIQASAGDVKVYFNN